MFVGPMLCCVAVVVRDDSAEALFGQKVTVPFPS